MEYEILNFPEVDYNFFFKELPKHFNSAKGKARKKRKKGNNYASVTFDGLDGLVAGSGSSFESVYITRDKTRIPFDKYGEEGLPEIINSQKHAFFETGERGGHNIHYLKFGERILEVSSNTIQWLINWKSESIPKWLQVAYGELGIAEQRWPKDGLKAKVLNQRTYRLLEDGSGGASGSLSGGSTSDNYSLVTQGDLDRQRNNPRILEYSSDIDQEYTVKTKQRTVDPSTGKMKKITVEEVRRKKFKAYDDETPWCSIFIHWVMHQCGIQGPLINPGLALSWENWGKKLDYPVFGSIAIKKRKGGGHIAFVVGESDGNLILLGGNQDDKVCFMRLSASQQRQIVAYVYPTGFEIDPLFNYLSTVDGEACWAHNQNQA